MQIELDAPFQTENIPVKANHFVDLLLDYAKGKDIAGYFLTSTGNTSGETVSCVEWTEWKKKTDLRSFLMEQLSAGIFPFGIFGVKQLKNRGRIEGHLLNILTGDQLDLQAMLDRALDSYQKDLQKRTTNVLNGREPDWKE